MAKKEKFYYFEIVLYLFVGFISLAIPFFMHRQSGQSWNFALRDWERLIPFLLIFLVNNFLLVPKLLFKRRYGSYALSATLLILFAVVLGNFESKPDFKNPPHLQKQQNKSEPVFREAENPRFDGPPLHEKMPRPFFLNFGTFIIGLLIVGFNSGIKIFVRWTNEEDDRNEKERQYLSTELAFLKQQISPHFFMNTLNNIHALVDIDAEKSKDALIKLSRMMRYLLYESDSDKTSLGKEIVFLESYIELMRLRYDENKLTICLSYPPNLNQVTVPSLLFLPLVENAFKHGVDIQSNSFVDIVFLLGNQTLTLIVKNSFTPKTVSQFDEKSGIGLENLRKQLDLIYKKNYTLLLKQENNTFEVSLTIPIE